MTVYVGPESAVAARIERLALEARRVRQALQRVRTDADRRVLQRQLAEVEQQIRHLQSAAR
ncbi:MAG: hypothetical protein ACK4PI_12535 [Tepidisphaerales bacterium]